MKKIRIFLNGVKKEFSRIKWPDKKHMIKYSIATIVFMIVTGLFFYGLSRPLAYLWDLLIN